MEESERFNQGCDTKAHQSVSSIRLFVYINISFYTEILT